jgi:hypothetical protein
MLIPRLSGLKYKLVCHFKLAVDTGGGGIREFVNDKDESAFLETADGIGCGCVPVGQSSQLCKWTGAHLYISRASNLFLYLFTVIY